MILCRERDARSLIYVRNRDARKNKKCARRGSRNGEQSTRTADADLILEYYLYVVGIPAGCGILTGLDAPEDHDSHLASRRRSGSDIQLAFSRPVTPYLGSARIEVKVVREFVISRPHFTPRECPRIAFGQTDRDPRRFLETRVRDGSDGAGSVVGQRIVAAEI